MRSLLQSTRNTRVLPTGTNQYFRSDFPDNLTDKEIQWLLDNNIITIVDLRSDEELLKKPCSLKEIEGFRYFHLPVTGGGDTPKSLEHLHLVYQQMIDDKMKNIIDTIMNAESKVMYFCTAGKDRTGVVSALILKRLGFSDEIIIDDYMKSKDNLMDMLTAYGNIHPEVDIEIITPHRSNMEQLLKQLRHGTTADFSALEGAQTGEWLLNFTAAANRAFADRDDRVRLLANLLVLERFINTLSQGLAESNRAVSRGLQHARGLLWDYLMGRTVPADFRDFANDYYACLYAFNVGSVEQDAPKDFYSQYFSDSSPEACELLAVEWSSCLLIPPVVAAGGHIDFEECEDWKQIDFYGVDIMLNLLKDACVELTGISRAAGRNVGQEQPEVHRTPLFREIVRKIQKDLRTALSASPVEYASLQKEYEQHTIIPREYAGALLEY